MNTQGRRYEYDVIVAGASFAGLACTRALLERHPARVLLIDRWPPGTHQTSACALPLHIVTKAGAARSILQIHRDLVVHTPVGTSHWRLPVPYCTIDFSVFCREMIDGLPVSFLQAPVLGMEGHAALLPSGRASARVLVDATGWRATLASSLDPLYVKRRSRWMGVGVEVELPCSWEPGLHFYFDPDLVGGYAWAFGCGRTTRFGVASYDLLAPVRRALQRFLEGLGIATRSMAGRRMHGGRLASGLRPPVVGPAFVVGDAAGQCLPATGEGIRPAIQAGQFLGHLLAGALDGGYPLEEARRVYRRYHLRNRRLYYAMAAVQLLAASLTPRGFLGLARLLERHWIMALFMSRYFQAMRPGPCCQPRLARTQHVVEGL